MTAAIKSNSEPTARLAAFEEQLADRLAQLKDDDERREYLAKLRRAWESKRRKFEASVGKPNRQGDGPHRTVLPDIVAVIQTIEIAQARYAQKDVA